MNLIVLFRSRGISATKSWDPNIESGSSLVEEFVTDGYPCIFNKLIEDKVFDKVLVFVESKDHCGSKKINENLIVYCVPYIDHVRKFVKKDDVFMIRGGMRHWESFINDYSKHFKHFMVYYGAGVSRAYWSSWNVILNDMIDEEARDGKGRMVIPFVKPINTEIFKPLGLEKKYDVLPAGSFHIYERKGHCKVLNANRYCKPRLKMCLTGKLIKDKATVSAIVDAQNDGEWLKVLGMVSRQEMATIYNQTRLMVHLSSAEQNPRSILESLACGTPVMVRATAVMRRRKIYPSWVINNCFKSKIMETGTDKSKKIYYQALVEEIFNCLNSEQKDVHQLFMKHNSLELSYQSFLNAFKEM